MSLIYRITVSFIGGGILNVKRNVTHILEYYDKRPFLQNNSNYLFIFKSLLLSAQHL